MIHCIVKRMMRSLAAVAAAAIAGVGVSTTRHQIQLRAGVLDVTTKCSAERSSTPTDHVPLKGFELTTLSQLKARICRNRPSCVHMNNASIQPFVAQQASHMHCVFATDVIHTLQHDTRMRIAYTLHTCLTDPAAYDVIDSMQNHYTHLLSVCCCLMLMQLAPACKRTW
jgi:hypothetical protein